MSFSENIHVYFPFFCRGFEFRTSSRLKYPYHEIEYSDDEETFHSILDHKRHGKPKRKQVGISKPRNVTRGTLPVRQWYRIDESKISMEDRYGQSIHIDITDF